MKTWMQKGYHFLGLNRSMLSMLVMVVLLGLGEKMGERFLPVYLLALGGSTWAVGLLNAMDNFLSAIYAYIGGTVSDRLGYKRALFLFTGISLAGYAVVILIPAWQAVLAGAVLFISWTALSLPAILSLVSSTVRAEKQVMGVSLHSLVRRLPMALGPVLGGLAIEAYGIRIGARVAFSAAFVLGLASLWVIHRHVEDRRPAAATNIRLRDSWAVMPKELRTLLASDILVRFAEQIPYAFVVVWVMQVNGLSATQFSLLTVVEMVVAMMVYLPVAWLTEKTSSKLTVSITFGFFTLFPLVLIFSRSMPMLVLAFIIRGLKEFGEPTRKALIVRLAPEGGKAGAYGTYYLLRDLVVSVASLSAAWLWNQSPTANFLVAGCFGLAGTVLFITKGRDTRAAATTDA